jgi:hypothetical protein
MGFAPARGRGDSRLKIGAHATGGFDLRMSIRRNHVYGTFRRFTVLCAVKRALIQWVATIS